MTNFEEMVETVIKALRDATPREVVELGVLHGFCVDVAREAHPNLLLFLSSPQGLEALAAHLSRMPDVVEPANVEGTRWRFVEAAA